MEPRWCYQPLDMWRDRVRELEMRLAEAKLIVAEAEAGHSIITGEWGNNIMYTGLTDQHPLRGPTDGVAPPPGRCADGVSTCNRDASCCQHGPTDGVAP
jgi:hypothetical protein